MVARRYRTRSWTLLAAVALVATGLLSCGKSKTSPGMPSSGPVATPAPAPTPDPPLSLSCAKLPTGSASATCRDDNPDFINDVRDAIGTLKDEQPAIFDPNNTIVVVNPGAYYTGLIRILDRTGLCAGFDGEELQVKRNNDYSEQYKVLSSKSVSGSKYIGTCFPAVFPLPKDPLPPPPAGCSLPSSRSIACGDPPSQYEDLMNAAIQQVLKDKPDAFDFTDTSAGTGFPRVKDFNVYYGAVIDQFVRQGFCAQFDGEEMVVKRTNDFTEHFKINLSDKYVRYGPGIYKGACYPAAF